MRDHLLRLGRQTLVYGLSGVALQLVGVVTLPVMAHVFSTAEYGVLELIIAMIGVAGIFVDLGLASASQRSYYDYSEDQSHERRVVLATTVITSLGAALLLAAALIAARSPISGYLTGSRRYSDLIAIAALTLPATAVANLSREIMRLRFRAWHYLISSLLSAVLGAAFVIVSLTVLHLGLEGPLLGGIVGAAIATAYGLLVVRRDLVRGYSLQELRTMLDYGLPLVPTAAALWALALVDRLMLAHLSNLNEVGEYAMANRLGLVLTLAATAFATAFAPFMLSLYASDPEQEKLVRAQALTYVGVAFALVTVIVSIFAREAFEIIAPRFHTAYEAVGLASLGLAANGIANIAVGGIALARQTRTLFIYSGVAAGVNIALNLVVIPLWGMLGAAFATAVAYILLFALYYYKAQRVYPTPYDLARLMRLGALTTIAAMTGVIPIEPLPVALVLKSGIVILFLFSLRFTSVVGRSDIASLRLLVRERLAS
jgi:O-antigen/teichoic acid export membrane protein